MSLGPETNLGSIVGDTIPKVILFYVFFLNSYLYTYITLDICKGKILNFILLLIFSRHFLVFVYILVLFVSPQSAGD